MYVRDKKKREGMWSISQFHCAKTGLNHYTVAMFILKLLFFCSELGFPHPVGNSFFLKYIPSFPQTVPVKTSPDFNSVKNVSISLKLCLIIGNVPRPQILWYLYMAYSSEVTAPTFLKNSEISAYLELQQ